MVKLVYVLGSGLAFGPGWVRGCDKEQVDILKECGVQILFEVLHVKIFSPLVKDDGSYILHLLLMYCGK